MPPCWQHLFIDINSPVIDFYPSDFVIDLNGKKFDWQGVALLPFIEESTLYSMQSLNMLALCAGRLLRVLEQYYIQLTDEERARNIRGPDRLFISGKHKMADFIRTMYEQRKGYA